MHVLNRRLIQQLGIVCALLSRRRAAVSPQAAKVPLNEYEFPSNKIANVQSQLEKLVEKNYYLHQSARDAYRCAALLL